MSTLGKLFGKSPFGPLQEHMLVVKDCVDKLMPFFEAAFRGDEDKIGLFANQIFDLEKKADNIKNTLRDHLPRSLFMPVNRNILLEILDHQDTIADTVQDITTLFTLRPIKIPEQIVDDLRVFIDSSVKVCYLAVEISEQFDEMLDSSFFGAEAENVLAMIREINILERENDDAGINVARQIFSIENTLSPVDVFILLKLSGLIGDLANHAEKIGNLMRLFLAK